MRWFSTYFDPSVVDAATDTNTNKHKAGAVNGSYEETVREFGDDTPGSWRGKIWMKRWESAPLPESYEGDSVRAPCTVPGNGKTCTTGSDDRVEDGDGIGGINEKKDKSESGSHFSVRVLGSGALTSGNDAKDERTVNRSRNLLILETMLRSSYRAGYNDALKISPFLPFPTSPSTGAPTSFSNVSGGDERGSTLIPSPTSYAPFVLLGTIIIAGAGTVTYLLSTRLRSVEMGLRETLALVQLRDGGDKAAFLRLSKELGAVRTMLEGLEKRGSGASSTGLAVASTAQQNISAAAPLMGSTPPPPPLAHGQGITDVLDRLGKLKHTVDNLSHEVTNNGHALQKSLEGIEDLRHPLFGLRADVKEIKAGLDRRSGPLSDHGVLGLSTGLELPKQPRSEASETPSSSPSQQATSTPRPQHIPSPPRVGLGLGLNPRVLNPDEEVMPLFDIKKAVEGVRQRYLQDHNDKPANSSNATPCSGKAPPSSTLSAAGFTSSSDSIAGRINSDDTEHVPEEGKHLVSSSPRDHLIVSPYPPRSTRLDDILAAEKHSTPIERVKYPARADMLEQQVAARERAEDDFRGQVEAEQQESNKCLRPKEREEVEAESQGTALSTADKDKKKNSKMAPSTTTTSKGRPTRSTKKKEHEEEDDSRPPPPPPSASASTSGNSFSSASSAAVPFVPTGPCSAQAKKDGATASPQPEEPHELRSQQFVPGKDSQCLLPPGASLRSEDLQEQGGTPITHWWSFNHASPDNLWRVKGFGWYGSTPEAHTTTDGATDAQGRKSDPDEEGSRRDAPSPGAGGGVAARRSSAGKEEDQSVAAWAIRRARRRLGEWPFH